MSNSKEQRVRRERLLTQPSELQRVREIRMSVLKRTVKAWVLGVIDGGDWPKLLTAMLRSYATKTYETSISQLKVE